MRQITEVLRLNAQGLSYRQIAQSVGISASTVQSYLERAQRAGVVRADTDFMDIVRMVAGIAMVPTTDAEQQERLLDLALDGLRYRPHDS